MSTEERERRTRRSGERNEAMLLQLEHVREVLGFDALVVADDLGFPIVSAGDARLCLALADSAMWHDASGGAVDELTLETLQEVREDIIAADVHFERLEFPDAVLTFLGVGRSMASFAGFEHAAVGLSRIYTQCAVAA